MSLAIQYGLKKRKECAHGGMPADCPKCMASGGEAEEPEYVEENQGAKNQDLVGRILAKRMSKGGKVANTDLPEADFMPNEFDDLHLRDDLESKNTGESSGDFLSSDGEEERRKDIVSRVLASLRKRPGHNPQPA